MEDYEISSFSAGEMSPRTKGRIDKAQYQQGCELLLNEIILPQGGAMRRPGSIKLFTTTTGSLLSEFEGTDGVGYLLVFKNLALDIYSEGVKVGSTITTPWETADINTIQGAIDENKMYFVQINHQPQILTYTPDTPGFSMAAMPEITMPSGWNNTVGFHTDGHYPSVITFYEGRLVLGASKIFKNLLWGSNVKKYAIFSETADNLLATDAFEVKVNSVKGPILHWIMGARGIFVGTNRGVYSVSDENTLLSPVSLITSRQNSSYPASTIPGIQIGGELFYIQLGRRKVRVANYDSTKDMYTAPDITSLAEHITSNKIKSWAVQTVPETFIWCITDTGELLSYTFSIENQVYAWTRHGTKGKYKSIAVIREGDFEKVYVIVDRNGTEYLELFHQIIFAEKEYMYLDGAVTETFGTEIEIDYITYTETNIIVTTVTDHDFVEGEYGYILGTEDGSVDTDGLDWVSYLIGTVIDSKNFYIWDEHTEQLPITNQTGVIYGGTIQKSSNILGNLDHLEGEEVHVMSGPVYVNKETVENGSVNVYKRRISLTAGLNYNSDIVPMNIAYGKNRKKRIISTSIEVVDTIGGKSGKDEDNLDKFKYEKEIRMDYSAEMYAGTVRVAHRGGHEFNGDILIRQDLPLPMTVVSLMVELEVQK